MIFKQNCFKDSQRHLTGLFRLASLLDLNYHISVTFPERTNRGLQEQNN